MDGNGTSARDRVEGLLAEAAPNAEASRAAASSAANPAAADRFANDLFDELLPPSLDWRHLVQRYPHAAVAVAVAAGFWVGRKKSGLVLAALTSYFAAQFGDAMVGLGEGEPGGPGH